MRGFCYVEPIEKERMEEAGRAVSREVHSAEEMPAVSSRGEEPVRPTCIAYSYCCCCCRFFNGCSNYNNSCPPTRWPSRGQRRILLLKTSVDVADSILRIVWSFCFSRDQPRRAPILYRDKHNKTMLSRRGEKKC